MDDLRANLISRGASLVGFANLDDCYQEDPHFANFVRYPYGISIAAKIPAAIIQGIAKKPTIEYFHTYHALNDQLDKLALYCEEYLVSRGYRAYAQTAERTKGFITQLLNNPTMKIVEGISSEDLLYTIDESIIAIAFG